MICASSKLNKLIIIDDTTFLLSKEINYRPSKLFIDHDSSIDHQLMTILEVQPKIYLGFWG